MACRSLATNALGAFNSGNNWGTSSETLGLFVAIGRAIAKIAN